MRFVLIIMFLLASVHGEILPWQIAPKNGAQSGGVNILDAKEVRFAKKKGIPFTELSDLAYNVKTGMLYGVSDQGFLYGMKIAVHKNRIVSLELLSARALRDRRGKKLEGNYADAEGLAWSPDGLLISFERKPRIGLFDIDGKEKGKVKLPKPLRKARRYYGKNKMLEAVAWSPEYGIVTAPELPLKSENEKRHTIYAGKQRWSIPASGSVTALEIIQRSNLLVLERDFHPFTRRRIITLTLVDLKTGKHRRVLQMDSDNGWDIDNFEGLTRLEGNRYLLISDDNDSPFQKTLLMLFEIKPDTWP